MTDIEIKLNSIKIKQVNEFIKNGWSKKYRKMCETIINLTIMQLDNEKVSK